jgi:hypothetical protein
MKHMMWALVVTGLFLVGSVIPAEAARGGPGGGGGGARSAGSGAWYGGSPRGGSGWYRGGGAWYGASPRGGGGYYHGGSGGRYGGTRVFIGGGLGWWGGPGWGGPGWWGPSYPYYAAPPVAVQQAPTEYIQQEPAPPAEDYWYYCQSAGAYYPYVKECPGGWMQVVPQPAPTDR